jgi:hypothetical protein
MDSAYHARLAATGMEPTASRSNWSTALFPTLEHLQLREARFRLVAQAVQAAQAPHLRVRLQLRVVLPTEVPMQEAQVLLTEAQRLVLELRLEEQLEVHPQVEQNQQAVQLRPQMLVRQQQLNTPTYVESITFELISMNQGILF